MEPQQRKEIERLYRKMYSMLFEYARSSLSSDALAEEAVQDTFAIACQKPDALLESPSREGWLVNVLKNVICNTLRNQSTARRFVTDYVAANVHDIPVADDQIGLDVWYGDMVGMENFRLLKEFALDGRSYLEMAQARGISVVACRKRVQRAKELLRKKLKA